MKVSILSIALLCGHTGLPAMVAERPENPAKRDDEVPILKL
jgi:hypothetical protein